MGLLNEYEVFRAKLLARGQDMSTTKTLLQTWVQASAVGVAEMAAAERHAYSGQGTSKLEQLKADLIALKSLVEEGDG